MTLWLDDRAILSLDGPEARDFLQGLITNDVRTVSPGTPRYAALLTPQGKILFDFLVHQMGESLLIDCAASARDALAKRLTLYRLRAKVTIAPRDDLRVAWNPHGAAPVLSAPDPRHAGLGSRDLIEGADGRSGADEYRETRLSLGIPEGEDFGQDRIFALDAGLDELHGVAFDKGCYVGQELTARMKHRGTARKRLLSVSTVSGAALPAHGEKLMGDGQEIGLLQSVYGARGFALVRLDRLQDVGEAAIAIAETAVQIAKPDWLFS
jgi:folate-binding protein YgfZ